MAQHDLVSLMMQHKRQHLHNQEVCDIWCFALQVYNGMLDAARGVLSRQGVRGLYSGLNVTLVEIMPYAALQFGLYDLFTAAAARAHSHEVKPRPASATSWPLQQLTRMCALFTCIKRPVVTSQMSFTPKADIGRVHMRHLNRVMHGGCSAASHIYDPAICALCRMSIGKPSSDGRGSCVGWPQEA